MYKNFIFTQKIKKLHHEAEIGVNEIIEISSSDEVDLDVPVTGVELAGGWSLFPLNFPQVSTF